MRKRVLAASTALGVFAVFVAVPARGADMPVATFSIGEESFAVYETGDTWLVARSPLPAALARDATQLPPACEDVETRLSAFEPELEGCRADATTSNCRSLEMLVELVRSDPDTIGVTALAQGWRWEPAASSALDPGTIIARAASETGQAAARIRWLASARPVGPVTRPTLLIKPDGASWLSKLHGFIDFDNPSYDAGAGAFVTRDHVLACGLLAGDARIHWEQVAEAEAGGGALFEPDQLWSIYRQLTTAVAGSTAGSVDHALRVGVAVGAALDAAGLDSGALLDMRVSFVLDAFFEGDQLAFKQGLSESEVRALASAAHSDSAQLELSWLGVVP